MVDPWWPRSLTARHPGDIVRLVHRGLASTSSPRPYAYPARSVPSTVPAADDDPATYLPTGEFVENGLSAAATVRLTEIELREPDFNKFTARPRAPAGGEPQRGHRG